MFEGRESLVLTGDLGNDHELHCGEEFGIAEELLE